MALLGTHTLKGVTIHVTKSANISYPNTVPNTIVMYLAEQTDYRKFDCTGLPDNCNSKCPFYINDADSCVPNAIDFLHTHYSAQYPEYFI